MAKFDIESFRDYWINLLKDNLDVKLSEISAEKSDGLVLESFLEEQWTNDLNEKIINYESFVLYNIEMVNTETVGSDISRELVLTIQIVFNNQEDTMAAENKILRYVRAMTEILLENSEKSASISDIGIKEFTPVNVTDSLGQGLMKVGGLQISGVIA